MEYGIVYLLTNPVMPGLVKIGMTTQEGIDKRMKELYTTGVPIPFECKFACKVKKSDCLKIEKALHKAFDPQRINQTVSSSVSTWSRHKPSSSFFIMKM
ncbi:GIY-YIG nuclease family protein [Bacteroides caccae]|uniref:GIY-YIG nuclease family protein n=1 Tax=Bacteroides caccae TaxID=47678 RepID=A0AAW7WR03_9BACE|nr:GIY-YIG nuclease family protein [Bacteroides caccae]MDO6329340.1 GIY-YIG nuclease family protein [Bacteroides caccae]MDO6341375.1 GIY-YIG nuclease family protein [Bacteroides caccae]MDO6359103.1 GIY-YIG nuclease family protein [Bacteroides caccae]